VKQTQARQLQNSNTPVNAQMQAITKIFPVFFAFICLGLNAGATLYFVVSNVWRIGQQHLVIGKMYDQAIAAGDLKPKAKPSGSEPSEPAATDQPANGKGQPSGSKGAPGKGSVAKRPPPAAGPKDGNGSANGKGQGMSSGARRKKRKR